MLATTLQAGLFAAPPIALAGDPLPVASGSTTAAPTTPGEAQVAAQSSTAFGIGDVFVAVGNGLVQWRLPDGTLNATLDTGLGGFTTGMAFDKTPGNLYVTNFSAGAVTRFDTSGNRLGTFGTGYNANPESILFDAAGDAYVGQAGGTADLLQFDGGGQLQATYDVPIERRGSDWIDLAIDQCTMYYTSEGTSIKRFDVCANAALPDLTSGLTEAFALRILPGGQRPLGWTRPCEDFGTVRPHRPGRAVVVTSVLVSRRPRSVTRYAPLPIAARQTGRVGCRPVHPG